MAENKQQDTNKLLQVRRDKLAELQAAGKDPFEITLNPPSPESINPIGSFCFSCNLSVSDML